MLAVSSNISIRQDQIETVLGINIAFYLTAGVTILFLHNWFSLLAQGTESLAGNHQAWVIWAAVDTMLPLVLGTTGCRIMREKS